MGNTTPNIGVYIPSAGETGYDASFASGMINVDQHDHSGAPNKGVPIASAALADNSVTFSKLDANVADTATGIGTETGVNAHKLTTLGVLKSIYQLGTDGFLSEDGTAAHARTLTGTANQIAVTNPKGITGDPVFSLTSPLTLPGDLSLPTGTETITAGDLIITAGDETISAGDLTVTAGTIISNNTNGITFDSTNKLANYATGTSNLTMIFSGTGDDTGWTYTAPAKWWQIGAIVFFQGRVVITNRAGGYATGSITLTGLTSPNSMAGNNASFIVETLTNIDLENRFYFCGEINAGSTTISLWMVPGVVAGTRKALNDTDIIGTSSLTFNGFYFTA